MQKIVQFVPIQLTFFLISGILFADSFLFEPLYIFSTLCLLILALGISFHFSNASYKKHFHFNVITYLLCFFIGISTSIVSNELHEVSHYSHNITAKNKTVLVVDEVLKSSMYHCKYIVRLEKLNHQSVTGKVLLNIQKDSLNQLQVDDRIFLQAAFKAVNKPLNLYQFDYNKYLKRKQIYHQINTTNTSILKLNRKNTSLKGRAAWFRNKVNDALMKNGFEADELAVMNALLLGQRNEISKELLQQYANAGAIHILALSGLHVGIVLLLLNFLLKPLERFRHGRTIKLLVIVSLLWSFAFIAGMSSSIVRAVTMFTAVAIGWHINRPTNVYNTLVMSLFLLILIQPTFIFDVGFQLSYLAVFSIVWIQPLLYKLWKPPWKVMDYFWQLLTVSMAAQFGILPLSIYYFHQFPGLFFVSNLIIIPALGLILALGFITIFLSLLNFLPTFVYVVYNQLIKLMNTLVEWIGLQESFLLKELSFSFLMMLSVYGLLFTGIRFFQRKNSSQFLVLLVAVLILQGALIYEKQQVQSTDEFIVFHKNKQSIIGKRKGDVINIYHNLDSINNADATILKQYVLGVGKIALKSTNSIPKIFKYNDKKVLIVDSLGIYQVENFYPTIVLLQQSPKINLTRLIDSLAPKTIVADGSNYRSYITNWKKICNQKNTPFHYTGQKGAFILRE